MAKFRFVKGFQGEGIMSKLEEMSVEGAIKAAPYVAKKAFSSGCNLTAGVMRDPKLQQKAVNYLLKKGKPLINVAGKAAIDELSDFVATKGYKRKDIRKGGRYSQSHW